MQPTRPVAFATSLAAKPKIFIDGEAGTTGGRVRERLEKPRDDLAMVCPWVAWNLTCSKSVSFPGLVRIRIHLLASDPTPPNVDVTKGSSHTNRLAKSFRTVSSSIGPSSSFGTRRWRRLERELDALACSCWVERTRLARLFSGGLLFGVDVGGTTLGRNERLW